MGTRADRDGFRERFPLKGFDENRCEIPFVDSLSDADLTELNAVLDWNCFTVDRNGRRFGNAAWAGKRTVPEPIPNPRIVAWNEKCPLAGKHVLEIGCLEGAHTLGLSRYAGRVTAVDARIENVVKTIVRCALHGTHPTVFKCDVEDRPLDTDRLAADLVHHVGVLYHLVDPVAHLLDLARIAREGILLDTHVALEDEADRSYRVDGRSYRYKRFRESGHADAFSGTSDHSKWLLLDDLTETLRRVGFGNVEIVEQVAQRNGARIALIAGR